jgi:hypothetical protein
MLKNWRIWAIVEQKISFGKQDVPAFIPLKFFGVFIQNCNKFAFLTRYKIYIQNHLHFSSKKYEKELFRNLQLKQSHKKLH